MARITINEAAKQGFKSRSQINKDIRPNKDGKIKLSSFEERGRTVVDVADLVKLYGEPGSNAAPIPTTKVEVDGDRENV